LLDRRGADAARLAELAFEVAGGQVPCASAPDLFYAEKYGFDIAESWGYGDQEQVANAKNLCNTLCEIRLQCLEYAMKHNETHGIWGGLSPKERQAFRSKHKRRGRMSEADARLLLRDGDR
jgi:hypothetical protein